MEPELHLETAGEMQGERWGVRSHEQGMPRTNDELGSGKDATGLRGRNSHLKEPRGGGYEGLVVLNLSFICRKGHLGVQDCRVQDTPLWCGEEWGRLLQKPAAYYWGTQHWQTPSYCHLFSMQQPAVILEHKPENITLFRAYHTPLSECCTGFTSHYMEIKSINHLWDSVISVPSHLPPSLSHCSWHTSLLSVF